MNTVLDNIISRRTIRRFLPDRLAPEALDQIIEAGLWAPSGGGRQSPVLLVCQDAGQNERLGRINRAAFGGANSDGIHFVSEFQKSIADDDSILSGFYGAPAVVTLLAPERWAYGIHDCTASAENMLLAAWSLGIGGCFVSRAEETFRTPEGRALLEREHLDPRLTARVCLCLGYPAGEAGPGKPRRAGRTVFVG